MSFVIFDTEDLYHLRLRNDIKYFNIAPFFSEGI
jgi:hypothetical protein